MQWKRKSKVDGREFCNAVTGFLAREGDRSCGHHKQGGY